MKVLGGLPAADEILLISMDDACACINYVMYICSRIG